MKLLYNPLRELNEVHQHLSQFFGAQCGQGENQESLMGIAWSPLVDIIEDEKEFQLKVELSDIKKEDIKIRIEDGTLRISGERKSEKEEKGKKFHRLERSYGSFMRSFTIPDSVDAKKIRAEFKEGLLIMHLPKEEGAQGKSLEIKID